MLGLQQAGPDHPAPPEMAGSGQAGTKGTGNNPAGHVDTGGTGKRKSMKHANMMVTLALGGLMALSGPVLAQSFPALTKSANTHAVIATVVDSYPVYKAATKARRVCERVRVPIYRRPAPDQQAGNIVAGAIIGGALGQVVTGNKNGATAGAVIGGIAGANQNKERIVGYRTERRCRTVKSAGHKKVLYYESQVRLDGQIYRIRTANPFDPGDRVRLYMPD